MFKFIIIGIIAVIFSLPTFATTLNCEATEDGELKLLYSGFSAVCKSLNHSIFTMKIGGAGFIVHARSGGHFKVHCPFQDDPTGYYAGGQLSAGSMIGVGGLAFAGSEGVCTAGGLDFVLGLDAAVDYVKIRKINCNGKRAHSYECETAGRLSNKFSLGN
ncbi:MAG: hypothetical protein ACJ76H_11805 [Bacteriovoracaceae bacterium]